MINYKQLHYFWAVAKTGSIVRACEQLNLTPQTIMLFLRTQGAHKVSALLALTLVFIGAKMLPLDVNKTPTAVILGVVTLVIAASVVASLLAPRPAGERTAAAGITKPGPGTHGSS